MKRFLLLLSFCAFFALNTAFSQVKLNVDSLTAVAENYPKEDTTKIKMWLKIGDLYLNTNPMKGLEAAEKALAIAQKIGQPLFIAESFLGQSRSKISLGKYEESIVLIKQALQLFEAAKKKIKISDCMMIICMSYGRMGETKLAIEHLDKTKAFCLKEGFKDKLGICANNMGAAYLDIEQAQKSITYSVEGLKIATELGNKSEISRSLRNLGAANANLGDYPKSLDYYQKALTIAEELNFKPGIATIYNNTAEVYQYIGDFQKSLEYQIKALNIAKELNNIRSITRYLWTVGLRYSKLDDTKNAIFYYQQALEKAETLKDSVLLVKILGGLGQTYIDIKEYAQAFSCINKSLKISAIKVNNSVIADDFVSLGRLYNLADDNTLQTLGINPEERFIKSETAYLQAIKYAQLVNDKPILAGVWLQLSELYEKKRDFTQAYDFYKKYIVIKDSISGNDIKKQITRKEIQYEFDKKEKELKFQQQLTAGELEKERLMTFQQGQTLTLKEQALALSNKDLLLSNKEKDLTHLAYLKEQAEKQEKTKELSLSEERGKGKEKDLTLKNLELSAQQKQNLYLGLFSFFLLGGLGLLTYFYATLKKQKNIIAQQNELNEHTIAILSHDIKEPLLGVKLMLKKINKDDPFVAQASQSLENQINAVNGILNNLLKIKKLSLGKKDKNATANVNTVVKNVMQELSVAIQSKGLTIKNELEDDVMIPIAPEKLQIIVHNLLYNAVKYSFQDQIIKIYQEKNGFIIQDFGVGLSEEQRSKLMHEVTASQQGTKQERGNGMGLFLVGVMLQGEQIKVLFDSPEIGGTIVKILG